MNRGDEYAATGSTQASPALRKKVSVSASMAIESLREQIAATHRARERYDRERTVRDNLIRDARSAGIPVAQLMRVTGLGRDRISKINCAPKEQSQ